MHRITFRASNTVNINKVLPTVVMKTVMFQNDRKLTFNSIYFANKFGGPDFFFALKYFF